MGGHRLPSHTDDTVPLTLNWSLPIRTTVRYFVAVKRIPGCWVPTFSPDATGITSVGSG